MSCSCVQTHVFTLLVHFSREDVREALADEAGVPAESGVPEIQGTGLHLRFVQGSSGCCTNGAGLLKKVTSCNHLKHVAFPTRIEGNHHLQGNAQVYNVRNPQMGAFPVGFPFPFETAQSQIPIKKTRSNHGTSRK